MVGNSEETIRMRAYLIWEREGRPHGRDIDHWLQAQVELLREPVTVTAADVAPAKPARARSNGGSKAPAAKSTRPRSGRSTRGKST